MTPQHPRHLASPYESPVFSPQASPQTSPFFHHRIQVLFVGKDQVGKTALINRIKFNTFTESYLQTPSLEHFALTYSEESLGEITLNLFDAPGAPRFWHAPSTYIGKARHLIVVYVVDPLQDINEQLQWSIVQKHDIEASHRHDQADLAQLLVFTKADLVQPTPQQVESFELALKLKHHYALSSKRDPDAGRLEFQNRLKREVQKKAEAVVLASPPAGTSVQWPSTPGTVESPQLASLTDAKDLFAAALLKVKPSDTDTEAVKAAKRELLASLVVLEAKTLVDFKNKPAQAWELADATHQLSVAVNRNEVNENHINAFTNRTNQFKSHFGWRAVLGAVVGALVGLLVGAGFGCLAGVPGCLVGALTGAVAGASLGGMFGMQRTHQIQPLTQVSDNAHSLYQARV